MGIFDFIKSAGKSIGLGGKDEAPSADALKKELDSHSLGTDKVTVEVKGDRAIIRGDVSARKSSRRRSSPSATPMASPRSRPK